jgi:hypothetical protein
MKVILKDRGQIEICDSLYPKFLFFWDDTTSPTDAAALSQKKGHPQLLL